MEARLPADKLAKIKRLLNSYLSRSKLSLVEIQSLVGLLNFAYSVVVPGRCFLRRLIEITRGLRKPHHRVRVTRSAKADMQMWLRFIEEFNGKSFFLEDKWENSVNIKLNTDASNIRYGRIFGKRWFLWGMASELGVIYHITVKELFPIVLALETWGHLIANKCIYMYFYTDNEAVSEVINKQSSQDESLMELLRRLVYVLLGIIFFLDQLICLEKLTFCQIFHLDNR